MNECDRRWYSADEEASACSCLRTCKHARIHRTQSYCANCCVSVRAIAQMVGTEHFILLSSFWFASSSSPPSSPLPSSPLYSSQSNYLFIGSICIAFNCCRCARSLRVAFVSYDLRRKIFTVLGFSCGILLLLWARLKRICLPILSH